MCSQAASQGCFRCRLLYPPHPLPIPQHLHALAVCSYTAAPANVATTLHAQGLLFCLSYQVFSASVMLGYDADDKVSSWFLTRESLWAAVWSHSLLGWLSDVTLGYDADDKVSSGFLTHEYHT